MIQENPPIDVSKNNTFRSFKNDVFGKIRTFIIDNEPYFVARDIATALGYANPNKAILDHIDERDRLVQKFHDGGQARSMTITNESGLYSLVLSSRKEDARDFQYWITSEVLPEIRRTGGYTIKRKYPVQYKYPPVRNNNSAELMLNTVVEALSKIRINIDVNVHYPEKDNPGVTPSPRISQDNPVYDERIKALENKLDKLIDALGGVDNNHSNTITDITDEADNICNMTDIKSVPAVENNNGVKYYSPTYIANQMGLVTISGNPHALLITSVAKLLGIRTYGNESYCDGLVKIAPFTTDDGNGNPHVYYHIMFSDQAINIIIDKLNEIWSNSYSEEFYKINGYGHQKGDFKRCYLKIGNKKHHLGKRYIPKTNMMENEKAVERSSNV